MVNGKFIHFLKWQVFAIVVAKSWNRGAISPFAKILHFRT